MVTEPLSVFKDFGKPATLRKKDGSVTNSTTTIYDEAVTEEESAYSSYRDKQPHFTFPLTEGEGYEKDDIIEYQGKTYKIDDDTFADETIITFAATEV